MSTFAAAPGPSPAARAGAAPGSAADAGCLAVTPVRAFADNYVWLVHGTGAARSRVAVVDPGDARPVLDALQAQRWVLDCILVTHHHADHIGGVTDLSERAGVPVYGPARESIPGRTVALRDGDRVSLDGLGLAFDVLEVPGHTAGHIAYVGHGALFCGDTLFSGGCGRLFEGTPAQMLASLDRLAALPAATRVYCAHEYTAANLRFAQALEPGNADLAAHAATVAGLRARDEATVPSSVGLERRINPFLRTREPAVRLAAERRAARPLTDDVDAFAVVRQWKNEFR